jgi:transcriptional regulator with XRE-family HTH domain
MGATPVRNFRPATLTRLRRSARLTQEELAEAIGTFRQHLNGFEKGRITPSPAVVAALARILEVDPLELTIGTRRAPELSDLRERAGYSQVQLAEAIGMPRSSYSLLERGGLALHDDVTQRLAGLLQVDEATVAAAYQRTRQRRGTGNRHGH